MITVKNKLERNIKNNRLEYIVYIVFLLAVAILSITGNYQLISVICDKVSDLFLRLMKLLCLPIVFLSIATTISKLNALGEKRKEFVCIFSYTLLTTVIAAIIGLIMFLGLFGRNPGNVVHSIQGEPEQELSFLEFANHLETLIPTSIFEPFIHGNIISIALMALIFGMSGIVLPKREKRIFNDFLSTSYLVMINIVRRFVPFMPLIAFTFLFGLLNDFFSFSLERGVLIYLVVVVGANLIQALLVLPSILAYHKIPIIENLKAISPALIFAFFSKSTSASLPLSLQCAEEKMGIKSHIARFSYPICTMINMNGCAAFILVTSLYVLTDNGASLGVYDYALITSIAILAAVGNAGVPMGCFFMTTAILTSMGANLELLGVIFPFYMLLDMLESVVNLWSDTCVTLIVNKAENKTHLETYSETPLEKASATLP